MAFKRPHNKKPKSNYAPPYAKEILDKPVAELDISDALKELLTNGFIKDVYAIAKRAEREMYGVKFFNKKHLAELKRALQKIGVEFKPDEPPQTAASETDLAADGSGAETGRAAERPPQGRRAEADGRDRRDRRGGESREGVQGFGNGKNSRGQLRDRPERGRAQKIQPPPEPKRPVGPLTEADWTKYTRNGRWGYIDSSTNQIKVQPVYDEIFAFREGLACAEKNEKFGYIDTQSNVVIPFEYDLGMSFKDGLACVTKNNRTGYISKDGEVVIDFRFEAAMPFEEGVARVKEDGKWLDIDKGGATLKVY
ncbi:MAG: WG repeat-containing protein [Clostridiales bacterium]|jgi:hypothetical protein|nr:WG repeat-containing protein [Clostridiales bacterium]